MKNLRRRSSKEAALEELRAHLNNTRREDQPKLPFIPFLVMALARALRLHLRRQVMVYRGRTAVFA